MKTNALYRIANILARPKYDTQGDDNRKDNLTPTHTTFLSSGRSLGSRKESLNQFRATVFS